jgi:hypothetical protein
VGFECVAMAASGNLLEDDIRRVHRVVVRQGLVAGRLTRRKMMAAGPAMLLPNL